jgi:hypothetical protein
MLVIILQIIMNHKIEVSLLVVYIFYKSILYLLNARTEQFMLCKFRGSSQFYA